MRIPRPLLFSLAAITTGVFADTEFAESEPLIKRVDHWEGPMFEQLSADRTGIDFTFSWDPPEHYRWHFDNAVGGGVAIGDYDDDGRTDVYLTRAFGGSRLYRNLGDFGSRMPLNRQAWTTAAGGEWERPLPMWTTTAIRISTWSAVGPAAGHTIPTCAIVSF